MSQFNTYRLQVNFGTDLRLKQSRTILGLVLLHLLTARSLVVKALLLLVALSLSPLWSGAATWRVASLEWPPFAGSQLPEGGAGIAVLRAALKAEGIELQVEYFPWSRAILMSKRSVYAGLYPTWSEDVPPGFIPSVPIFKSPVGLVESIRGPVVWSRLEDLRGKTIGTVQDYGNTPEFMALIGTGAIKTEVVDKDVTNIRKVAAGRIDAAFIDLNNLDYLLKHEVKDIAHKVQANKKQIEDKLLFLAINNKFESPRASEIIRNGMSKIDSTKIIKDYLTKYSL